MQVQFFPEQYPELRAEASSKALEEKSDLLVLLVTEEHFQEAGRHVKHKLLHSCNRDKNLNAFCAQPCGVISTVSLLI